MRIITARTEREEGRRNGYEEKTKTQDIVRKAKDG